MRGAGAVLGRRRLPRPALALRAPGPRLRLALVILVLLCLALAAGYRFWLRDSSFVSVDDVKVSGLTTKDAERASVIQLRAIARRMSLRSSMEVLVASAMHSTALLRAEFPSFTIYPPSAFLAKQIPVLADTCFCSSHQLI